MQHKNPSPETTPSKGCDRRRKTVSSKQTSTDNHTHDPKGGYPYFELVTDRVVGSNPISGSDFSEFPVGSIATPFI